MRPDMAKVVTERPRRGHGELSLKTSWRLWGKDVAVTEDEFGNDVYDDVDYGRTRIKASRRGQCRHRVGGTDAHFVSGRNAFDCHKEFSDLLGPLRGYLRKQVGRPWDKVYSELKQHLDFRSVAGLHIWDHVKSEVTLDTYMRVDGQVGERGRYGVAGVATGLYVHPYTRLLCWTPKKRFQYRPKTDPNVVKTDDPLVKFERVNGIWYRTRYSIVDSYVEPLIVRGVVYRQGYFEEKIVFQRKRQLSRKELRTAKLSNVVAA